jgi:murein DD-endopeptidase MepM/ murein hydrolase activator NlpD
MRNKYNMKNNIREWKSKSKNYVQTWIIHMNKNISVPVVLLLILALGAAYGMGSYTKNLTSKKQPVEHDAIMQFTELQSLRISNEWLKNRIAVLQEEKAVLLDTAVADLDKKSKIIESILSSVGVDIEVQVSSENSGGPFISTAGDTGNKLILRTDQYLDTIQNVPLGAPVPGVLTSRFGWRNDPINDKRAYHRGVDIRGKKGSDVKATANGIVKRENYDRGNGRYVLVDHGNGFITKYAHMKKSLVKKGDAVERGQVIGLVGSTGRSTGPHVHYEIHYDDKILNPTRFVRIARYLKRSQNKNK